MTQRTWSSADWKRGTRIAVGGAVGAVLLCAPVPGALAAGSDGSPSFKPASGPRDAGAPRIETAKTHRQLFFDGRRAMSFYYRVAHRRPAAVKVQLVRARGPKVLKTWRRSAAEPGRTYKVRWGGLIDGKLPSDGRYYFRVTARDQSGAQASSARAGGSGSKQDSFGYYRHKFPIRGRHDYGSAGSRFGAGRSGHSHQGQDVFARCGTRLVAARGGTVKYNQYHSAAGYYLVIDGSRTGVDYVYMHLRERSPLGQGSRVYTGQRIGSVGESGNAVGCHLHFEMWSRPGWYDGGKPFDPLPDLKAWDRYS